MSRVPVPAIQSSSGEGPVSARDEAPTPDVLALVVTPVGADFVAPGPPDTAALPLDVVLPADVPVLPLDPPELPPELPPGAVDAVVAEPGETRNGAENVFGAVKSFWFWPT